MAKKLKKKEEKNEMQESKPVEAPSIASNDKVDGMDKWKVEDAANTLLRAEEVKNDPKLFEAAKKQLAEKGEAIGKITSLEQLRKAAEKKLSEDDED